MIRASRTILSLAAALPLLFLGCTKNDSAGDTSGTALYLYDGAANEIAVWKDLDAAYTATTTPAADLTLTSSALTRSAATVAWGGMALDAQRNHLYLLYQDGFVIRIDSLRSQSGTIQTNNLVTFTLDSSQRLTGSAFGQLALDPQTDTLYASESGSSGTSRVWAVSSPDTVANNGTAPFVTVADDESGTGSVGVAAGRNSVFAYFASGNAVISGTTTYHGPRLRKGTGSAFEASSVIIGDTTGLDASATGSLAFDTANTRVFVGLDAGSTSANSPTGGASVLAFQTGQFGLSPNQAPSFWLGDSTTGPIKVLAHPGVKAWLVGLKASGTTGQQDILVWKQPASGVASKTLTIGASGAQYLAAALDGTGS